MLRRVKTLRHGQAVLSVITKAAELTLVTSNEREFRRVTSLRVQNWAY